MSVSLTNAEKQARYRHLGVNGETVRAGLNLNPGARAKSGRLARDIDYTITVLVDELLESEERRVPCRMHRRKPSEKVKSFPIDRTEDLACHSRSLSVHPKVMA
jgi:hypothetical protein